MRKLWVTCMAVVKMFFAGPMEGPDALPASPEALEAFLAASFGAPTPRLARMMS
jgi:hypothetical protein